jgi:hypothetical protein
MKISKTHKDFAYRVQKLSGRSSQDVLKHPENYLGPNWGEVINFWLYLDTLSENQLLVVEERYSALICTEWCIARGRSWNAAKATIRYAYDASYSAYDSVSYANCAAEYATDELLGLDKLLEQGYQPVFFPMFLNP